MTQRALWTAEQRQHYNEWLRAWRRAHPPTPAQRQLQHERSAEWHRANRDDECAAMKARYQRVKATLDALNAPHRGAPLGRTFTTFTASSCFFFLPELALYPRSRLS